jgi:hypothetical protein
VWPNAFSVAHLGIRHVTPIQALGPFCWSATKARECHRRLGYDDSQRSFLPARIMNDNCSEKCHTNLVMHKNGYMKCQRPLYKLGLPQPINANINYGFSRAGRPSFPVYHIYIISQARWLDELGANVLHLGL